LSSFKALRGFFPHQLRGPLGGHEQEYENKDRDGIPDGMLHLASSAATQRGVSESADKEMTRA
jgi:hypothetical protein